MRSGLCTMPIALSVADLPPEVRHLSTCDASSVRSMNGGIPRGAS